MQRGLSLGALHIRPAGGQFLTRGGVQATENVNLVPFWRGDSNSGCGECYITIIENQGAAGWAVLARGCAAGGIV